MEKMEFPWLRELPEPIKAPVEQSPSPRILMWLRSHSTQISMAAAVILLALVGRCSNSPEAKFEQAPTRKEILVMSLVAIPKGHRIPVEALSEVQLSKGSLTKTQRLRALLPEHLPKLRYDIVAKRDIAPQTPLFWTDLMLQSNLNPQRRPRRVRIVFDETRSQP
jgi:hypothetical protein